MIGQKSRKDEKENETQRMKRLFHLCQTWRDFLDTNIMTVLMTNSERMFQGR